MTEERAEQVTRIKALLGISDEESQKDALVVFSLENAEEIIKNYCHIQAVPDGLATTLLRMAADIFRKEQYGEEESPAVITSISEGDTSTGFSAAETTDYTASILKNYKIQLRRYRKVAHG